jgi:hypothetical protein
MKSITFIGFYIRHIGHSDNEAYIMRCLITLFIKVDAMKIKILILILLLSVSSIANAQTAPPLVIHIDGQIYRWSIGDSEPTFTNCDLQENRVRVWNYSLVQSALGEWVAFNALPADFGEGAPTPTGNLWVCNVNTGEAYALTTGNPGIPNIVSEGAFSPDGSRILWAEIAADDTNPSTASLRIHDFGTRETTTLVESVPLDFYCGVGVGAPRVIWGDNGIVAGYALTADDDPCSDVVEIGFSHYAEEGTLLNSFPVENANFEVFEWLADTESIAFTGYVEGTPNTQIYTLNMATGEVQEENAALEAFIPNTDPIGGRYLPTTTFSAHNPPLIYFPDGEAPLETNADVALSPDADVMAIVIGHTLYFAENGTIAPAIWNATYYPINDENAGLNIPDNRVGQFEVAWAAPSYRLVPMPEAVCPSVEQLYLMGGGNIAEGLGDNNLRNAPHATAQVIDSIPEGSFLSVIDMFNFSPFNAPPVEVCSEGVRWREVIFEGQLGWTAESQGDTYYMVNEEG